jgi:hypothetical protein
MFGQRAPWWMYLLAAAYISGAALVVYVEYRGAEDTGIEFGSILAPGPRSRSRSCPTRPRHGRHRERRRVVSLDGRPIAAALYWGIRVGDMEIGKHYRVGMNARGSRAR